MPTTVPRSLGKLRTLVTMAAVSVHVPPLHPISASTTRSQKGPGMRLACHTAPGLGPLHVV